MVYQQQIMYALFAFIISMLSPLECLLVSESGILIQILIAWISQSYDWVSWVEAEEASTEK